MGDFFKSYFFYQLQLPSHIVVITLEEYIQYKEIQPCFRLQKQLQISTHSSSSQALHTMFYELEKEVWNGYHYERLYKQQHITWGKKFCFTMARAFGRGIESYPSVLNKFEGWLITIVNAGKSVIGDFTWNQKENSLLDLCAHKKMNTQMCCCLTAINQMKKTHQ